MRRVVITAHPDDETLWFGGTILSNPGDWSLVCVTLPVEPAAARRRSDELREAARRLGMRQPEFWSLPDDPMCRLDVPEIERRLERWSWEGCCEVHTHGPAGEYGHPHHQDVAIAVHRSAAARGVPVLSPAYHSRTDHANVLPGEVYARKLGILSQVYRGEFYGFVHLLGSLSTEAFTRVALDEAESVYAYLSGRATLDEVRSRAAVLADVAHPWLRAGADPPVPQRTFGLLAALDALGSALMGAGAEPTVPKRLQRFATTGGLRGALRRLSGR